MYFTDVEDRPMGLKPMNCPAHVQIFKRERRSYRDLPIRYSEQGLVHRHEPSGTLHGLLRVRHITQDDAHIFCTEEQIEDEVVRCLDFGFFDLRPVRLRAAARALHPAREARRQRGDVGPRRGGAASARSTHRGLDYEVNEGDGAFYGPKIDLHMTDSIGRSWQLGTVQLDYYMPERFDLAYTGADNAEHRPVMIHRALMGSFERFIGILDRALRRRVPALARAGAGDRAADRRPPRRLRRAEVRRAAARRRRARRGRRPHESVGRKIRDAELRKVPYMLVVGDREAEAGAVAVRRHREGDLEAVAPARGRAPSVAQRRVCAASRGRAFVRERPRGAILGAHR